MYTIKTPIVILSLMILFFACTELRNKQYKKILMLENTLQDSYDTLKMAKLVESYDKYVNDFPTDSLASVYVFRAAEINRVLGFIFAKTSIIGKRYGSFIRLSFTH
jgi:hypothetical protein